jgi:hypothetical protein
VLIATVENALETERYQPYGQQAFYLAQNGNSFFAL